MYLSFLLFWFPSDSVLFAGLSAHYVRLDSALILEYKEDKVRKWLKWLPSIGIGYNLKGEPRPTFSFSLSQVLAIRKAKHDQRQQKKSARLRLATHHHQDSLILSNYLRLYHADFLQDSLFIDDVRLDSVLFDLRQHWYKIGQIDVQAFIQAQKANNEVQRAIQERRRLRIEKENKILVLCKC